MPNVLLTRPNNQMPPTTISNDSMSRDQIAALNRLLCNLANLQSGQRRDQVENFRRYGVLLEAILSRLDKFAERQEEQEQQMQRLMALGLWWDERDADA